MTAGKTGVEATGPTPTRTRPARMADAIGDAVAFPSLARRAFLNHAATAPLCTAASLALANFAHAAAVEPPSWPSMEERVEAVRDACARMIGARPNEIDFMPNTSQGISTVALGLDWRRGDHIVLNESEYSSNRMPWFEAAARYGLDVTVVPERVTASGTRRVALDELVDAMTPRTRVLAVSHVQYCTGQRLDVRALGEACRDRGVLLCVDAIQSVGVVPVDVDAMGIDALAVDGHKWLLGPPGAGFLYVRDDVRRLVRPAGLGWRNAETGEDGEAGGLPTVRAGEGRFECGSLNLSGVLALGACLDMFLSFDMADVAERVGALTSTIADAARARGYEVVSPRDDLEWSGIVSFSSSRVNSADVRRHLRDNGIDVAVRKDFVRASPHFYIPDDQLLQAMESLP